jgi:serine protease Do
LPIAISVLALTVSLSHGLPGMRAGHAADQKVTNSQKQTLVNLQDAFSSIAESVEPAVVNIQVDPAITQKASASPDDSDDNDDAPSPDFNPFGDLPFNFGPFGGGRAPRMMQPRRGPATGSGVIVQRTGNEFYILTNYHVVEGGGRIKVQVNGLSGDQRGALVGTDPKTDLAVVKMRLTGDQNDNRVAKFGNSDNVKVGQWAIAIGNPLDVGQTLTVGVVSAKGRSIDRIQDSVADYSDMIQTDASINPGNSGGALVDINGDLIGVNTAIASTTNGSIGIGFAIPSNTAQKIAQELIRHGEVVRGWLGVLTYQPNWEITPTMAKIYGIDHGAFIDDVTANTPASKAGIKPEDIVTQWGSTPIRNYRDLTAAGGDTPPGQDVKVTLYRDGKEMSVTVHTEKRPDEKTLQSQLNDQNAPGDNGGDNVSPQTVKANGITVRALTGTERQTVGLAGVMVTAVDPGSAAADAGLAPGLVIHKVDRTPIASTDDFKAAMSRVGDGQDFALRLSLPTGGRYSQRTVVVGGSSQ